MYYTIFEEKGKMYLADGTGVFAGRYVGRKEYGDRVHNTELSLLEENGPDEHDVYTDAVSLFSSEVEDTSRLLGRATILLTEAFDKLTDQKLRDRIFEFLNR